MKTIEPKSATALRCTFCHLDCNNTCPASQHYYDASNTCSIAPGGALIDVRCTRCFQTHGVKATCICSVGAIAGAVLTQRIEDFAVSNLCAKDSGAFEKLLVEAEKLGQDTKNVTAINPFPEIESEENKAIRQRQLMAFKSIIEQSPYIQIPVPKEPEPIEAEARRLVTGDRQAAYSHPIEDFTRTAKIWSGILGIEVTPNQVAMCMVGVKLSRECHKHKRDSLVDAVGYLLCLDMVIEAQGK